MSPLSAAELFNVKDMVFVVTGGGSGIGTMMAKALDENGAAKVYILGRRLDKLEEVSKAAVNKSMIPIKADVTSKEDLAAAATATRIKSETGFVNVVIANSGVVGPTLDGLPKDRTPTIDELQAFLWKVPQDEYTNTFAVNATAMFYTLTAFLALLDAGNKHPGSPTAAKGVKSQFVVTSSLAGFSRRMAAGIAYSGSKAAATHIVKNMATFLVPYHIRANVIAPGIYPSEINNFGKTVTEEGSYPQTVVPSLGREQKRIWPGLCSLCAVEVEPITMAM